MATATPSQTGKDSSSCRGSPPMKKSCPDDAGSETSVASFPPLKPLAEVMPCYPNKLVSFHDAGIPSKWRPVHAPHDQSFYKCPYSSCPKDSHNKGTICSHIGQVHLGVCLLLYVWVESLTRDSGATHITHHHPNDSHYPFAGPQHTGPNTTISCIRRRNQRSWSSGVWSCSNLLRSDKKRNCWWLTLNIFMLVRVVCTTHKLSEYILPS